MPARERSPSATSGPERSPSWRPPTAGSACSAAILQESVELGRQAIDLARRSGDPALNVAVLPAPVYTLFARGDFREALAATEEGLRLAGEERTLGSAVAVVSPYAWLLLMRGLLQGWTGRLGEAKRNLEQAIQVAGEDGDAETEAWAHMMLVAVGELADAPRRSSRTRARRWRSPRSRREPSRAPSRSSSSGSHTSYAASGTTPSPPWSAP
jgi:hypothetical protein